MSADDEARREVTGALFDAVVETAARLDPDLPDLARWDDLPDDVQQTLIGPLGAVVPVLVDMARRVAAQ